MYFSGSVTLLGSESINISEKEVLKEIIYNSIEYRMIYTENYNVDSGLDINLTYANKDITNEMFNIHADNSDIPTLDPNNISEYYVYFNNSEAIPSAMTVTEQSPIEISLYSRDDNLMSFTLVPSEDGIVIHLRDTVLYAKKFESNEDHNYLPVFYTDNLLMKYVFTNGSLINIDYNDKSVWIVDASTLKEKINIKYSEVELFKVGNYSYKRWYPIRLNYTDYKPDHKSFIVSHKYSYIEDKPYLLKDIDRIIGLKEEANYGNGIKEYDLFYPIHYASILGNIFMDSEQYKIYANEEIIVDRDKVVSYNIEYHRLDKNALNNLFKLVK